MRCNYRYVARDDYDRETTSFIYCTSTSLIKIYLKMFGIIQFHQYSMFHEFSLHYGQWDYGPWTTWSQDAGLSTGHARTASLPNVKLALAGVGI